MPPWRNGIRGRLRACARKGVVVRVHSGAPDGSAWVRGGASRHTLFYGGRHAWGHQGRLAQLAERLLYTQDVRGSSPLPPTNPFCARVANGAQSNQPEINSPWAAESAL